MGNTLILVANLNVMNSKGNEVLLEKLLVPDTWPDSDGQVLLIETHISWVFLSGEFAYKIKKPVDFGFLDFSTLEKRQYFCEEELRLNGRLAPELYLAVVPVCGSPEQPVIDGEGAAFEYAVKMRRFDQAGLLSNNVKQLSSKLMDDLALQVADFHGRIAACDRADPWGEPDSVFQPVLDNFQHIGALEQSSGILLRLGALEEWTRQQARMLSEVFLERKERGFIRECHGDLHLGNITLIDDKPVLFDGIEFNPALRWIDTMNEIAFLLMDLEEKGRPILASRFLNRYLEETGDYAGLKVLRFYQMYRAMVRAKVTVLRIHQPQIQDEERARLTREFSAYLDQAEQYTLPLSPALMITFGASGSGKSYMARHLAEQLPAIRIRSDVERKRLAGLQRTAATGSGIAEGIYSKHNTTETYGRLQELAAEIISAGFPVIVDATFLKSAQRKPFLNLAARLKVPSVILQRQVAEAVMRKRIRKRLRHGRDPSEANERVLSMQLQSMEPLDSQEAGKVLLFSSSDTFDTGELLHRLAG